MISDIHILTQGFAADALSVWDLDKLVPASRIRLQRVDGLNPDSPFTVFMSEVAENIELKLFRTLPTMTGKPRVQEYQDRREETRTAVKRLSILPRTPSFCLCEHQDEHA